MSALQSSAVLPWMLSYLFNALWQIPMVFAAAWIATRILRRAGPLAEHRVWVGALLLEVVLPACDLRFAPLWSTLLSLLPSRNAAGSGSVRVLSGPAVAAAGTLHLPFVLETGIVLAWACVVAWFALRLAWGIVQTHKLASTAMPVVLPDSAAARWGAHCARFEIAPLPQIVMSPRTAAPITIGMRRALVLLPPQLLDTISPDDLDAVLAHELAHIARRDFTKNLLYSLLSLPIVWHPIAWRTRTRLSETRELICDEAAVLAVAGRRQYAHSLLRLAAAVAGQPRFGAIQAVGILDFTSTRALERRVMSLTRKRIPMSTGRRILLAATCSVLALATCTSALALHTDVSVFAPTSESRIPTKIHVKANIMARQRISGDNPIYPPAERLNKTQGTVVIDLTVSKEGAVEDLHAVKTPNPALAESALKAVRTWRYHPYLLNGDPVAVQTTVEVTFCLEPCQLRGWWNEPSSGQSPDHN